MPDEFVMLGEQSPQEIAQKLREIGDEEVAQVYEARVTGAPSLERESFLLAKKLAEYPAPIWVHPSLRTRLCSVS